MTPRLSETMVEIQIREMWDALSSAPKDEGHSKACEEARRTERELRGKLERQKRLEHHAQDLHDALRLILDHGTRSVDEDDKPIGVLIEGCEVLSTRFEQAWLGAIEVIQKVDGEWRVNRKDLDR